jgi:hypothetical protein
MIPGSNILNMALRVISKQCFDYYKFMSRTKQPNGQFLATYYAPQNLSGSVQPVPRELFEEMGLDLQRTYMNFFVSQDIIDVKRDVSGDQFFFAGRTFQCLSITPWIAIDGWNQVLAVVITNAG